MVHFLLVDFGGGYLLLVVTCCDGGETKSTPCLTDLDCNVRLDWSLTKNLQANYLFLDSFVTPSIVSSSAIPGCPNMQYVVLVIACQIITYLG